MKNPEKTFEELCSQRRWKFYKIPELSKTKTPDYFVIVNNTSFIVEIKNLSESRSEDRPDIEKLEVSGEVVGQSADYNKEIDSVVKKIGEANNQFRTTRSFNLPNLLVIYSNRLILLNKELVLQSMYGKVFQRLLIKNTGDILKNIFSDSLPPIITDRTLRKDKNNLISAVAIPNGEDGMFVLHNLWADIQFSHHIFNGKHDINYVPAEIEFKEIKF